MKSPTRLVLTIGTATAACILTMLPAAAATPDPKPAPGSDTVPSGEANITVTDDGWVLYRSNLEKLGAKAERKVVNGAVGRGGKCTTSGVDQGAGGTTITVREEVGFNPATCETEYLVAELTPAEAAKYLDLTEAPAASRSGATNATAAVERLAALATYNRWVRTAWVDPIDIDISSQKVALQWNSSTWLKRKVARNSFKGCISGMCLDQTYIVSQANYYGNYSNRFEFSGVTHFRNTAFANWVIFFLGPTGWAACGFPTSSTANFHHDEQVVGYKSGAWAVNWDDTKKGACTNLVHHESSNGGTWPF